MLVRVLALAAALLAASACGGGSDANERAPAERVDPPRLAAGDLPGSRLPGTFRDEHGRRLSDVRELIAAGQGDRRVALLVARGRGGVVCHGLGLGARREGQLDCLEPWENPPLVLRVAVGGESEASTDWLVTGGLVRGPAERVVVQSQSGAFEPLELREWPGLAWRGFLTRSAGGNLANMLTVLDGAGDPVTRVDLAWAYIPPCHQGNDNVCAGASPPPRPWAEARDPVAAAHGASNAERAKWLAFREPGVRRLVDGRVFSLGPTAGWHKCSGEDFGAVVALRLHPPADFEGEIPIHEYAEDDEPVAYRTGRARVVARDISAVQVWIDLRESRVVGIGLDAFDDAVDLDTSSARIEEREIVEEPRPAGGPDDPDSCPQHEFGD